MALLIGCSGEPSAPSGPEPATITVSVPSTKLTALGETVQLGATVRDSAGKVLSLDVAWSTATPHIASVSGDGLVTAMGNGTASIVASVGDVTASTQLVVEQEPVGITVTLPGGRTLIKAIGATRDLVARVLDANNRQIQAALVTWHSSAESIVEVSSPGRIVTRGNGKATITAASGDLSAAIEIEVATVLRMPIDPYLATPIADALWEVPVIVLAFIPTADGANLDVTKSPDFWHLGPATVEQIEQTVLDIARRRKMAIEEGSRFHGYANPAARPSIGYRVVDYIITYDLPPASDRTWPGIAGEPKFPDYFRIFADLGLREIMEQNDVREIWMSFSGFDAGFPSYDPAIHKPEDMRVDFESNMASPVTGDVSNSFRWNDDLPLLDHTYVVYGMTFRRSQAEAVHCIGHHIEATLAHVNWMQDGNSDLFWKQFVGQDAAGNFITGRAGWTHMPPNTVGNYDYLNPTVVPSDIEDWMPAGGATRGVSVGTWGNLQYPWPGASEFSQRVETQWYTYWFQNMPGHGNDVPHPSGGTMTNWWAFFGDWDAAIQSGMRLYTESSASSAVMSRSVAPSSAAYPIPHPIHQGVFRIGVPDAPPRQ